MTGAKPLRYRCGEVAERSARSFARHDMAVYAMALAYRGLFGIFPFAIFLVAVLSWGLASLAFSFFLTVFPDHGGALYGSLGTAISLLLYLYFSAAVLLFGAELNAELRRDTPKGEGT